MYIYDLLLLYFNTTISTSQHGLFTERSTLTNLLPFSQYLYNSITENHQVDVIETDFSKAFTKVNTILLIKALNNLGLPVRLLNSLISYLTERQNTFIFTGF